jgi:3'-5' exoribonuclease
MQTESAEKVEIAEPTVAKIFVKDLQDKQSFNSLFLARDKALLNGKNGKSYISLFLADKSGAIDARVWDNVDLLNGCFQSGDIVRVKGQVQMFQGRRQVIVHRLEKAQSSEYEMADFVSAARRAPDEMLAELIKVAEEIEDSAIRQLTLDTLSDPEIRARLLVSPAAKTIHHAYAGGLLEHILSICGLMKVLHAHYAVQDVQLKLDLLIFGAIFHDIGKIWELEVDSGILYSDKGKLLGHMIMAVELVEKKASRILGFPEQTKDLLKHIILSHHGKLEYGSPKLPMFLEAVIVAAIDDLDSKINTISGFVKAERQAAPGESWSKFNQLFERCFYLK